ncbi:ribonuclease III [Desulforegula conservatrix]|uniref:ribonuclease III n=1 Tax=Desulforegula conservatrix TaxID=153026 RepID=UPI000413AC93|nr:ribonuclease III [Desulforegula conservatrix]
MKASRDYNLLENNIGYSFKDRSLLQNALRHSSYVNEKADHGSDNERLEFLGDAVLNLVIGHLLMDRYPDQKEGVLSKMRANLVNEVRLSEISRAMGLGPFLLLGKGELITNGREKNSILADAFEAIIASVYLDGGFESAFSMVRRHFQDIIIDTRPEDRTYVFDAKSKLQEMVQTMFRETPVYRIVDEEGPDHDKTFKVLLKFSDMSAEGAGKSKKTAEQEAARKGLDMISDKTVEKETDEKD